MKEYKCIIFDSDGVLVDSETLSAKVFQQMAVELGFDLDFETTYPFLCGIQWSARKNQAKSFTGRFTG